MGRTHNKICPVCKKEFYVFCVSQWGWRISNSILCSRTCFQRAKEDKSLLVDEKMLAHRKKALDYYYKHKKGQNEQGSVIQP